MSHAPATAPPGYVTVAEAAERAGVSRSAAWRQIRRHKIATREGEYGAILITEKDAARIRPRVVKHPDGRVAVMVRVPKERYKAWKRAARKRPVSTWLGELGDAASGWDGEE